MLEKILDVGKMVCSGIITEAWNGISFVVLAAITTGTGLVLDAKAQPQNKTWPRATEVNPYLDIK